MKTTLYKIAFSVIFSCSLFTLQSQAQQVQVFNTVNSDLPDNNITSIAIDAQGNKWFVTGTGEVAKFDNAKWTIYDKAGSGIPGNYRLKSIAIDSQDNKWFGTYDAYNVNGVGGLVKFDNTNWTIYYNPDSGSTVNQINKIAVDAQGNKWIATRNKGVVKFDDTNWTVYNSTNSDLPDDYVSEVKIDDLGNKWFATLAEVTKFDDTIWTIYESNVIAPGQAAEPISSIVIDDEGEKWVGLMDESWDPETEGGVAVFDDVKWSFYNSTNSGLPLNGVYSIAIDAQGNKWFGTAHTWNYFDTAVAKFDGSEWTVYNSASGLPNDIINLIAIDAQGNKWFATANSGVVEFNENGITTGLKDNISVSSDDFTIYPNPAKDFISVEGLHSGTIEIFNSAGAILKNYSVQGTPTKVDISNLPDGIYSIRAITKDQVAAKKFTKN